jgi:flagellar motor switch protein FliM
MARPNTLAANPIEIGQPVASSPKQRLFTSIHEQYAAALGTALSAFLRTDLTASLRELSSASTPGFLGSLPSPTCLMVFRLHPRPDRMYLHMNCGTVFALLELLLGGKTAGTEAAPRNLTEIEWSLLEEIVRVIVRPLGEAWKSFAAVEFEAESLVSEPGLLPPPDSTPPLMKITVDVRLGEETLSFEIATPQTFFDAGAASGTESSTARASGAEPDVAVMLARLDNASVDLEVRLEGTTASVRDLAGLQPGQVLTFDYPLDRPLRALLNGEVALEGQIVGSGPKRALQIVSLPKG